MVIYKCSVCGYEFNEEQNGKLISEIDKCPVCKQPQRVFKELEGQKEELIIKNKKHPLEYPQDTMRFDPAIHHMGDIHRMAVNGSSIIDSMATEIPMPNWNDILIIANQLNPLPLDEKIEINTTTVIGKGSEKPMLIENPVYISHMSFGALSYETKVALAKSSAIAKTAMCSGEGGILEDEMKNSYKYIFEYITPTHLMITNITRDQPPRNSHPEKIYNVIKVAIKDGVQLILNVDDPFVNRLRLNHKGIITSYGVSKNDYSIPSNLISFLR